METMQQMEILCRQRKSKNSCCVFHFRSKYRVVLGKCNRKEVRGKKQEIQEPRSKRLETRHREKKRDNRDKEARNKKQEPRGKEPRETNVP